MAEMYGNEEKKAALIIIDLQKKYALSGPEMIASVDKHINTINEVSALFRKAGRPVFIVKMNSPTGPHMYGGPDREDLIDDLDVCSDDVVLTKSYGNTFIGTDLDELLKKSGCNAVILAGLSTQYCVMSTYYGAFDQGYEPYLLKNGTITFDESVNDAAGKICMMMSVDDVKKIL